MLSVLAEHELLGDHLGFGVEVVESLCVGQGFITTHDLLTTHHDAVGCGVDEAGHTGGLCGVQEVLGAVDVDGVAALPVLVGDRSAAHEVDDRCGVEDRVDAVDHAGQLVGVGDVADDRLQQGMVGQWRGARSKERTRWPRSSSSVTRLAPTKPEPPVTSTWPSSVVSVESPMLAHGT